eukprot:1148970-Pelagomonas_calceolata.AAC.1
MPQLIRQLLPKLESLRLSATSCWNPNWGTPMQGACTDRQASDDPLWWSYPQDQVERLGVQLDSSNTEGGVESEYIIILPGVAQPKWVPPHVPNQLYLFKKSADILLVLCGCSSTDRVMHNAHHTQLWESNCPMPSHFDRWKAKCISHFCSIEGPASMWIQGRVLASSQAGISCTFYLHEAVQNPRILFPMHHTGMKALSLTTLLWPMLLDGAVRAL